MKNKSTPIIVSICILLLMVPPLSLLYYINAFGVNVVFWDDWQEVNLVQKTMNRTLSFSDLLVQHNEHRMPFPDLFMIAIEILTQYNMVAVMFFSWILICLTALFIFLLFRRQFHWSNYPKLTLIFLPALLILFSFKQWGSILWAITSQIYLMIFGVVAAFSLLEMSKKVDVWFASSILAASLASFSYLAGLLAWPVGLFQIIISKKEKALSRMAIWCTVSVFVFTSYFWGWVKPSYHPPLNYVLTEPVDATKYFFAFVGSPFFWDSVVTSEIAGLLVTLIAVSVLVYTYRSKVLRNNGVWLSLILFAALSALITTVGRSGFGTVQAEDSRYTPMIALGAIGLYFLALSLFAKPSGRRRAGAYALFVLVALSIISAYSTGSYTGWFQGQDWKSSREMGAYILLTYKMQSDENIVKYLCWDTRLVRSEAEFLEKNRFSVFSGPVVNESDLIPLYSDTFFALETINGKIASGQNADLSINSSQCQTITITGWAVDKQANDVASGVFITIDDRVSIPAFYGLDRSDVAVYLGNPRFRFSGYIAMFSSSVVSTGKHIMSLKIVGKGGHYCYCENYGLSFTVT